MRANVPVASTALRITMVIQRTKTCSSFFLSQHPSLYSQVSIQCQILTLKSSIVAGYPLIYHHVRALAEISQVRNIFLVGKYSQSSFNYFIESLYDEFCFNTVQYISDDSPNNEAGLLFRHREQFMTDDPEYFFCLRYKICSSFPLQKIISFHREKEAAANKEFLETQEMLQLSGQPDSGVQLAKLQKVNPLITVMGVKRRNHYGDVLGPTIISDALSGQILHYGDAHEKQNDLDIVNAGIYYISTGIF